MSSRKLLILGLDGLDRKFIDRNREELPNFDSIYDQTGFLESTLPPITVPAWACSLTGKLPEKLERFDFQTIEFEDYDFGPQPWNWEREEFWSYMSGKSVVIDVPGGTLGDLQGWKIGGLFSVSGSSGYPEGLGAEIKSDIGNFEIEGLENYDSEKKRREKAFEFFEKRRKLLYWFLDNKDADVYFPVFRLPDTMMHHCSKDEQMLHAYQKCDEMLGDLMERDDLDIVMVSDHGAVKATRRFSVNTWLKEKDYLNTRDIRDSGTSGYLEKAGDKLRSLALDVAELGERFGFRDYLVRANELYKNVAGEAFVSTELDLDSVDFEDTEAFSYMTGVCGYAGIWVNDDRFLTPAVEDRQSKKEEIKKEMEKHELVQEVLLNEEAFEIDVETFPDLVVVLKDKVKADTDLKPSVTGKISTYMHRKQGFLGVYGNSFEMKEDKAGLIDLAPTVLHYLGEDILSEIDGRVMDVFSEESEPGKKEPSYIEDDIADLDF